MKADFDAAGIITLRPESGVEQYALQQWLQTARVSIDSVQYGEGLWIRCSRLVIDLPFWDGK